MTDKQVFIDFIKRLKQGGVKYLVVVVKNTDHRNAEVIINMLENYDKKAEYYEKAYNDALVLNSFTGIKIADYAGMNSLGELVEWLEDTGWS